MEVIAMAQINRENIEKIDKQRNIVHDKVYATYTAFEINGKKYVQIDTYGRINRKNPEKLSQSIQFDKETAKFLIELLGKEFDLK